MSKTLSRIVIAIPARDETAHLPKCLAALGQQQNVDFQDITVVTSCNNCTDDTADAVRRILPQLPLRLVIDEVELPEPIAHAGGARRRAMDVALNYCDENGIILTTDADGVPEPNWVADMVSAFDCGADAVAGSVSTDWEELSQFPSHVLAMGAREWEYQLLSAELEAKLDPEPHDPWPRHNQTCGANASISVQWYRRIGGLPVIRTGEDSAMFDAVFRQDGMIRHATAPHVTVSARLVGRAQGGMADALCSRHGDHYLCGDLLEPADHLARRVRWRRAARNAFVAGGIEQWAAHHCVSGQYASDIGELEFFGAAWRMIEACSPPLSKQRIPGTSIGYELARIKHLITALDDVSKEGVVAG